MNTKNHTELLKSIIKKNNLNDKMYGFPKNYQEADKIIWYFENTSGDIITLAEDENKKFSLHSLRKMPQLPVELVSKMGKNHLLTQMHKLFIDLNRDNPKFVSEAHQNFSSKNWLFRNWGTSQQSLLDYLNNKDDSVIEKDVNKNYKLIYDIMELLSQKEGQEHFVNEVDPQTIGIDYSNENLEIRLREHQGMAYLEAESGGDWEIPILFFIYWSDKNNRFKGFFPLSEGNTYNTETNTAYGSEGDEWHQEHSEISVNFDEFFNRERAKVIGLQQLKNHILQQQ